MIKPDPTQLAISQPSLVDIYKLPGMFRKAIAEEYGVHDATTRARILRRHSLRHLLVARFKPGRVIFVVKAAGNHLGVTLGSYSGDGIGIVNWIYVLPQYRKMGVARQMLGRMEQEFAQQNCHKLTVTTEVTPEFYRRLGYNQEAIFKRHWWGKDFYLFSKFLKEVDQA